MSNLSSPAANVGTVVTVWFVGMAACAAILFILLKTGLAWKLATDIPNERSLHVRPTPRVGGWGLVPVTALLIFMTSPAVWAAAAGAVFLALVSQIDDRRGLPARTRFGAHLLAVVWLLVVYPLSMPVPVLLCLALALVWLVNLYNFMDGADGLAGGMAMFGFGGYALAAVVGPYPQADIALSSAALAGAALGFLLFNFSPAKIFLGDSGSIPIGYLAGAIGYCGWRSGVWPVWFPAMVFAPFIADASVTLSRRLLRGKKFWEAHREHYYQRMIRSGMGHAKTAIVWYTGMVMGVILALVLLRLSAISQWLLVGAWALCLTIVGAVIDWRWSHFHATLPGQTKV